MTPWNESYLNHPTITTITMPPPYPELMLTAVTYLVPGSKGGVGNDGFLPICPHICHGGPGPGPGPGVGVVSGAGGWGVASGFSSSLHKIDELIAAPLPLCLCPGWGRLGYGRESQLWHPPWCCYCSQPAGGHGGRQPREHSWPTYCCQVPGDTQRKEKQVESVYVCEWCACVCEWRQEGVNVATSLERLSHFKSAFKIGTFISGSLRKSTP